MLNPSFLNKLVILYVEDDVSIRNSMTNIFKKLFGKVIIAVNGQDGYDKFRIHKEKNINIDIVISDINMPDKNGIEMITDIRKLDENIPVVVTTAHSDTHFFLMQ